MHRCVFIYIFIYVQYVYNSCSNNYTMMLQHYIDLDSHEIMFIEDISGTLQAEVNVKLDLYRNTPLHQAAKNNLLKVTEMLLDAGADVNPKDIEGETPFDKAIGAVKELLAKHGGVEGKSWAWMGKRVMNYWVG